MKMSFIKSPVPFNPVKIVVFILIILSPLLSHAADNIIISISDFRVQSDNRQYKYPGKGLAEFISADDFHELIQVPGGG